MEIKIRIHYLFTALLTILLLQACASYQAVSYDFPIPVDTQTKEIIYQEKKMYEFPTRGIYFDNRFDGAHLNSVSIGTDDIYVIEILPENTPINESAYYAFKVWSNNESVVRVKLKYSSGNRHRYIPKLSRNGKDWQTINPNDIEIAVNKSSAILSLYPGKDTLWVAGQEVFNSGHVDQWCQIQAKDSRVNFLTIGDSKLGRPLYCLDIYEKDPKKKDIIVILSRQHPPEVTGYLAMTSFVEELLKVETLSKDFLSKFRILVFPLMNPDGVDLGHWRHNAGGIDLNRDWAYYLQPETRQIADFIAREHKRNKSNVILGLDFHSTYNDVFYTLAKDMRSHIAHFKDYWIEGIDQALPDYTPVDKPSGLGKPVSKSWFFTQFKAEGVTFEIGDETPRKFIKEIGSVSAREMMKLLIYRK